MVQRVQGLAARGVQPGDVIVGVNNSTLTSAEQFREQVAAAKAGDTLALRLIRDGNTLFVAVPVAENKPIAPLPPAMARPWRAVFP